MTFQDKLNFLIHITNTSAADLSEKTGIATSTISLYRSGKRKFPRSIRILHNFCNYFADRIENDYQRQALAEFSNKQLLISAEDNCMIAEQLLIWLSDKQYDAGSFSNLFLSEIFSKSAPQKSNEAPPAVTWSEENNSDSKVFFGFSGKYSAILTVLDHLSKLENPGTLYYLSDDCDTFISNKESGSNAIISQLRRFTEHGGKIQHILPPPVSPHFIDMIMQWSPLYLSGQANPVFFPFMRDALFRGTILVHENEIAMNSFELYHKEDSCISYVSKNTDIIRHSLRMFHACMEKCMPAFYMTTGHPAVKRFYELLAERPSETYCASNMLPLELTTIKDLQYELSRTDDSTDKKLYTSMLYDAVNAARNHTSNQTIYSCSIASANKLRANMVRKIIPGFPSEQSPFHTIDSYRDNLDAVIKWMEADEHHYLLPNYNDSKSNAALYIYHGSKAFVIRAASEFVLYEITEPLLVRTCEEYLVQRMQGQNFTGIGKANVLQKLKQIYDSLQE